MLLALSEDARLREQLGVPTKIAKILITNLDPAPGRTTVVLVRKPVGAQAGCPRRPPASLTPTNGSSCWARARISNGHQPHLGSGELVVGERPIAA